ncbi:MAG: WD40 repeat domain-containing protein [Thermodesulfobacteriota bacterium]|nr:WD40 repeat domain-containing protein [Thermodesulfobacteriota bacterium]
MKHFTFLIQIAAVGLTFLLAADTPGTTNPLPSVTIKKTFLSSQPQDSMAYAESAVISPDSTHLAYVVKNETGMQVMTNDKAGKLYDQIARGFPVFSPEKNRVGYIATLAGKNIVVVDETEYPGFDGACCLTFSPDGKSFAYIAQKKDKQMVLFNGTPHDPFDAIDRQIGLVFGPGSSRLAYSGLDRGRVILVIDGRPRERAWDIIDEIAFSPDAKNIACIATSQKKYFVVQNSTTYGPFDMAEALAWAPDNRSLVFVAIKKDNWITVKNGREIPSGKYTVQTVFNPVKKVYEYMVPQITPPVFSPDASRLAFTMIEEFRYRICVEDQKGPLFDRVGEPVFSPDSRHYAYIGVVSGKTNQYAFIYDGNPIATYEGIVPPVVFSPDARRTAFRIADEKGMGSVVVDGQKAEWYDDISTPVFSPDSKHVAYKALKSKKVFMVVDKKEHGPFDDTTPPFFSPDSNCMAYLAREAPYSCFLIVNDDKVLPFNSFFNYQQTPIVFDGDNQLHFIGLFLENNRFKVYRIDAEISFQTGNEE